MDIFSDRRGFYIVSPFIGFFIFLITVSIASFMITEEAQQRETAHGSQAERIVFNAYALRADAESVYLQNYLQRELDTYDVGDAGAVITEIEDSIKVALATKFQETYMEVYNLSFGVECVVGRALWSQVILTFNGQRGISLLTDTFGNTINTPFGPKQDTMIWPLMSRYGLTCTITEPPVTTDIYFRGRWFYLNASCICCQAPAACMLAAPGHPVVDYAACRPPCR